jgi:hypothetical protein
VRGRPFVKGQSGNPLGRRVKSQRFLELFNGLSADYGGPDRLTVFQRTVLGQACRLLQRAERCRDADMAIRLSNASMRALAALQHGGANLRKAPPKPPRKTFAEYLAQTSGGTP